MFCGVRGPVDGEQGGQGGLMGGQAGADPGGEGFGGGGSARIPGVKIVGNWRRRRAVSAVIVGKILQTSRLPQRAGWGLSAVRLQI